MYNGSIIPTDVNYSHGILNTNLISLEMRYPFLETGTIGESVLGRPIPYVRIGKGEKEVFYCASFHANEWITTPVLMKFIEDFSDAYVNSKNIYKYSARELYEQVSIYLVPMVNPDGVALVTGALHPGNNAYESGIPLTKKYKDGTTFEEIFALYEFDTNLRELFFKYLLQIERHLRSLMSYYFTEKYGESQDAYLDINNFNNTRRTHKTASRLIATLQRAASTIDYVYINY